MSTATLDERRAQSRLVTISIVKTSAPLPGTRKRPSEAMILMIPKCPLTMQSFGTDSGTVTFLGTLGVIQEAVRISSEVVAVWPRQGVELDDEVEEAIIRHVAACRHIQPTGFTCKFPRKNTKLAQALVAELSDILSQMR